MLGSASNLCFPLMLRTECGIRLLPLGVVTVLTPDACASGSWTSESACSVGNQVQDDPEDRPVSKLYRCGRHSEPSRELSRNGGG